MTHVLGGSPTPYTPCYLTTITRWTVHLNYINKRPETRWSDYWVDVCGIHIYLCNYHMMVVSLKPQLLHSNPGNDPRSSDCSRVSSQSNNRLGLKLRLSINGCKGIYSESKKQSFYIISGLRQHEVSSGHLQSRPVRPLAKQALTMKIGNLG